jgi:hypothetical protein
MSIGFQATLVIAIAIYVLAFRALALLRGSAVEAARGLDVSGLRLRDAEGRS